MIMTKYKFLICLMMFVVLALLSMFFICRTKRELEILQSFKKAEVHLKWHEGCGCCIECTCMHQEDDRIQYSRRDHAGECYCTRNCQCACTHGARTTRFGEPARARGSDFSECGCYWFERETQKRKMEEEKIRQEEEKRKIERTRPKGETVRCDHCNATGLDDGALCFHCNGWGRVEVNK